MTGSRILAGLVGASLIFLSGCRKADFLYYSKDEYSPVIGFDRQLKDLSGNDQLDLLWVIDNSASMEAHQHNVILNTQLFMNLFVKKPGIKWKMGLISTDLRDQPYIGFGANVLDWRTPDPVHRFQNAVQLLGINGSSDEMTFSPVMYALRANPDFHRPGAVLNVIVVSDAPEQSGILPGDFLRFIAMTVGGPDLFAMHGILQPQDFGCPPTDTGFNYHGSPYEAVIQPTKGTMHVLCDNAFARHLIDIGENMITRMETTKLPFPDGVRPKPASIRVLFHGAPLPGGPKSRGGIWTYDYRANVIRFWDLAFATGNHEFVRVEYEAETVN